MKIIKLLIDNFLRLKAVEINPKDNTVLITGANGEGKTSVLASIYAVFGGKKHCPEDPIHKGAESAAVTITTENWIIKRTFAENGKSAVTVTNAEGMRGQSPQQLLDKIVGEIAFDPCEFIGMGKTEAGKKLQRKLLMDLAGLDFTDLDASIVEAKDERADIRRDKERLEHEAKAIVFANDVPAEEVSLTELSTKLQGAVDHNAEITRLKDTEIATGQEIEAMGTIISIMDKDTNRLTAEIEKLSTELAELAFDRNEKAKEQLGLVKEKEELTQRWTAIERVDVSVIETEIANVEITNKLIRDNQTRKALMLKATAKAEEWATYGAKMKALELEKAERLSAAKFPVEGLSVSDDCVLYKDIPLSQEGGAKQLEVSLAIAMKKNPELRVIIMRGNELDDNSLEVIKNMIAGTDYQVWIERWANDKEESGIIIEDGSVKE